MTFLNSILVRDLLKRVVHTISKRNIKEVGEKEWCFRERERERERCGPGERETPPL